MAASSASVLWRRSRMFLFLVLLIIQSAVAQDFGFGFTNRRRAVIIPFEWQSNLIVVPVSINNSDTLNFILDTGISMNMITDPDVARDLNLKYVRKVNVLGVGQGSALEARVSVGNRIRLPGVKAEGQNVVVLSEDMLQLSSYVGMPVHGIFGFELFRNFVVKIDFRTRQITLYKPETYRYRGRGQQIPIIIEDTKPYLYASATYADNREVPIKVILDTGAGHALSLDVDTRGDIQLPDKIIRAQLGRGLNGIIHGSLGRLEKVRIGTFELQHVITSFPDTNSLAGQVARNLKRQGNIGCELLKRFTVIFDYSRKHVILKPNRRFYREKFERDMSGMEIKAEGKDYRKFVISNIQANSPAEVAGLQEGDEILSLNDHVSADLRLSDVIKVLQRGEGKTVKMFVKRTNGLIYTEFKLKRMI